MGTNIIGKLNRSLFDTSMKSEQLPRVNSDETIFSDDSVGGWKNNKKPIG
jgi:hypothetical protein